MNKKLLLCLICEFALSAAQAVAAETKWFIRSAEQKSTNGPYTTNYVKERLRMGDIKFSDFIWSESIKTWRPVGSVHEFGSDRSPAAEPTPPPFPGDAPQPRDNEKEPDRPIPASSVRNFYIIPMAGLSAPIISASGGPWFTFGGEVGFHTGFGDLGFFLNTFGQTVSASGITSSANVTAAMASLTGQVGVIYYGGRFGLGFRSVSASDGVTTESVSGSSFAVQPVVGLRFAISEVISIGAEVSWLQIFPATLSGTGGFIAATSVGYLLPLAEVKISF